MAKQRKVKRSLGTSEASQHFDIRNGWTNSSQGVSVGNAERSSSPCSLFHLPDTNAIQRFYKKFFHGNPQEYDDWKKQYLSREGTYCDGR